MSKTKRYTQIKKEVLAATWACEKFATYILNMKIAIETDHKPLVPLLGKKHLDSLHLRIHRFFNWHNSHKQSLTYRENYIYFILLTLSRMPTTSVQNDVRLHGEVQKHGTNTSKLKLTTTSVHLSLLKDGLVSTISNQTSDPTGKSVTSKL